MTKIDSLTELISQSENDSIKLIYTNQIINHQRSFDFSQAHPFIVNAIVLSKKMQSESDKIEALINMGLYYQYLAQYDSAINYLNHVLAIYEPLGNDSDLGYIYNLIGRVYHDKTDYINALKMHQQSLNHYQKSKEERRVATALINLGLAEFEMSNYEKASQYYIKSLHIIDKSDYHILKAYALKGMGMIYLKLNETTKALDYFRQMEGLLLSSENTTLLDVACEYIGKVYLQTEQYDSALYYSDKAFSMAQSEGRFKNMAIHQNNTGEIYLKMNEYDKALKYFKEALDMFTKLKIANYIAICNFNLAKTLIAQNKYQPAIPLLKESINNALISKSKVVVKNSYGLLAKAYAQTNQYDKAYEYSSLQVVLNDSILNEVKSKQISELQARYETEKKDLEISSLSLKNDLKQADLSRSYTIISLLIFVFFTAIVGVLFWKKNDKIKHRALELYHEKIEEGNKHKIAHLIKDKEIEMIKAGLNGQENERKRIAKDLHDGVGGTLSAAKIELQKLDLADNEHIVSISNRIDHACEEIRTISHHLTPPFIKNNSFISLIEQYVVDIEHMHNINISLKCYPNQEINSFSDEFKTEIYRIIQELTTNVVKHAKAKNLDIQLIKHEHYFNLMIEDDGIGFSSINTDKGIGLKNLSTRLAVLGGNFDIDSQVGKGTTINIDIQLEKITETV
jgi:two-component system, NarL family, sensor kinase